MPSRDAQAAAARVILTQWDPESTSGWLVENPQHPIFDTAALFLVQDIVKTDPEAAAAWASQIKDQEMRSTAQDILELSVLLSNSRRNASNPE